MDIIICNNSDCPIYEQIKEQIRTLIISGELKEGDALPSMRLLAKELRISVITTKRAYEDLEREGYIDSYTGKGSFVRAISHERMRESLEFELEEALQLAIEKARLAKITLEEMEERLRILYSEE